MSSRRKTHDGSLRRRSHRSANWGNTYGFESEIDKYAAPKRTGKIDQSVESSGQLFSEDSDKDRYLITYADLITLLLGLFIILYAISNVDLKKYEEVTSAMGDVFGNTPNIEEVKRLIPLETETPEEKLQNQLSKLIVQYNYENSIRLEQNSRGITIHIMDDVLFPSGNADLSEGSKLVLSRLAGILRNLKNDIRVEGHTDNVPIKSYIYNSNWHLSVARALNTAYYLINTEKLNPDKVSIVGYSEYKPIASNNTPVGQALNRRVDLVIITK